MIRKVLTILSLIGLLLSVGLWGANYLHIECTRRGIEYTIAAGALSVHANHDGERKGEPDSCRCFGFGGFRTSWIPKIGVVSGGQVTIHRFYYFSPFGGWTLEVSLWMPTLLCAVMLLASRLPLYRRRNRKKLGLCVKCGYDLRASKDRCPECGEEFVSSPTGDEF